MKRTLATLIQIVIVAVLFLMLLSSVKADGISGQVLDGTGSGVSGVLATLRLENRTFPPVCVRSDKDGRFAWQNLAAGQYFIQLSSPAHIFTPAERTVTLKAGGKPSLKFWAIPLPASVVPVPASRIVDADVITVMWLPQGAETVGKNQMFAGVSAAVVDGQVLRIEWRDGHAPMVIPLAGLRYYGYVPGSLR